jgi:hypothetical protein
MADQEKHQHLDEMLDSLLANYSSAEPRPGFETKILATVRSQRQKRKLTLGWIFAGGLATGSAVIAIALSQRMTLPEPPAIITAKTSVPTIVRRATEAVRSTRRTKPSAPQVPAPVVAEVKQEVFPSPTPLTEQEKLLLQYLRKTPREEVVAQSHPDKPVEVFDPNDDDQTYSPMSRPTSQSRNTK